MKQDRQARISVRIGFVLVLFAGFYQHCKGQDLRFNTSGGLVFVTPTQTAAVCLYSGEGFTEITTPELDKYGPELWPRFQVLAQMANDAAVPFPVFIQEQEIDNDEAARERYRRCQDVRLAFLEILTESAILEISYLTGGIR